MKEQFTKLIDVKTIVTFALVGTIIFLSIKGSVEAKDVYTMAMMVMAFYFGKQSSDTTIK